MLWCVVLQTKGTTRNAMITAPEGSVPTPELIGAILRRVAPPELIGTWKWNSHMLYLFAYKTGKAGTENKHELPPPHDKILLFGDAIIVAMKAGTIVSFGQPEFTKFYNEAFGGFEDLGSEDSEDDEEEEEEEEEEAVEEEEVEAEVEPEVVDDDDDDDVPIVVKTVKAVKRGAKKIQNFYAHEQLKTEPYALASDTR